MNAYERVKIARSGTRPMGAYYIHSMFDEFIELHGDRKFGDDGAVIGGIAFLDGMPVTVIAMERGDTMEDRMKRHFGCPSPDGYRKAMRLMKQAEKFNRPVICFVGSSGAYCGIDAEQRGQGQAIADNLYEMSTLKTPIVTVIAGEGGSGGALALAVADSVIMLENSVYSVISPEGCASILWKNAQNAPDAAEALKLTADDLYKFGVADKVIPEEGRSIDEICEELKAYLVYEIKSKQQMPKEKLIQSRYDKFRKIGK